MAALRGQHGNSWAWDVVPGNRAPRRARGRGALPGPGLAWILAVAACFAAGPLPAVELFGPGGVQIGVGSSPRATVVGDVTGDGIPEALTADVNSQIKLLLADGVGGFTVTTPTGLPPFFPYVATMALTDLDADGNLDLVTARLVDYQDLEVAAFTGDGIGSFEPAGTFPLGARTTLMERIRIASGDIDGDGAADIAISDGSGGSVDILLGDGSGGFEGGASVSVGETPLSMLLGDLNGDGLDDLVTVNDDPVQCGASTLTVRLSDGSLALPTRFDLAAPHCSRAVSMADFDSDSLPDLLVGSTFDESAAGGPGGLLFLRGLGDGTFAGGTGIPSVGYIHHLAARDLDGDGMLDVVAGGVTTVILRGDGHGGFSRTQEVIQGANETAIANFDRDGSVDLLLSSYYGVSLLRGDGLGGVIAGSRLPLSPGSGYYLGVSVADFDADQIPDTAVAGLLHPLSRVSLFEGDGRGGFSPSGGLDFKHYPESGNPPMLTSVRVDADDLPDLAVAGENAIYLFHNLGAMTLAPLPPLPFECAERLLAADVNEDGIDDLIAAAGHWFVTGEDPPPACRRLGVWLGDGQGGFNPLGPIELPLKPVSLATGDLDGDGHVDLAAGAVSSSSSHGVVYVLRGNGAGGFGPPEASGEMIFHGSCLAPGDVDADGDIDLVAGGSAGGGALLRNDGLAGFAQEDIAVGDILNTGLLRDVNGDLILDLIGGGQHVLVLLGDGAGGFSPALRLPSGNPITGLAAADLDADGLPDLVAVEGSTGAATWHNQLRQRADTNGSNRVDGFDLGTLLRIAGARRCTPQEAGCSSPYRREADVNLDGIVDGEDLALLARQFGQVRIAASPLHGTLGSSSPPDPRSVTLQQSASEGNLLTVEVLVHDTEDPSTGANFALRFDPSDGESGQVLELAGIRQGTYLAGPGQIYDVDSLTPGVVRIRASRLPVLDQTATRAEPLMSLIFRARRPGRATLDFASHEYPQPALFTASGEPVPVTFVGGSVVTVDASGGGPPGRRIGSSPEKLNFGLVPPGSISRKSLRISNFGYSDLEVTQVGSTLPEISPGSPGPFNIPPFGYIEMPVLCLTGRPGWFSGNLVITSDDPGHPVTWVPIEVASEATLSVDPGQLDFGRVAAGTAKDLGVRFTNRGTSAVSLAGLESPDAVFTPKADFMTIAPGQTATVSVRFSPATPGEFRGALVLIFEAPDRYTVEMTLVGTGL